MQLIKRPITQLGRLLIHCFRPYALTMAVLTPAVSLAATDVDELKQSLSQLTVSSQQLAALHTTTISEVPNELRTFYADLWKMMVFDPGRGFSDQTKRQKAANLTTSMAQRWVSVRQMLLTCQGNTPQLQEFDTTLQGLFADRKQLLYTKVRSMARNGLLDGSYDRLRESLVSCKPSSAEEQAVMQTRRQIRYGQLTENYRKVARLYGKLYPEVVLQNSMIKLEGAHQPNSDLAGLLGGTAPDGAPRSPSGETPPPGIEETPFAFYLLLVLIVLLGIWFWSSFSDRFGEPFRKLFERVESSYDHHDNATDNHEPQIADVNVVRAHEDSKVPRPKATANQQSPITVPASIQNFLNSEEFAAKLALDCKQLTHEDKRQQYLKAMSGHLDDLSACLEKETSISGQLVIIDTEIDALQEQVNQHEGPQEVLIALLEQMYKIRASLTPQQALQAAA